MGFSAKQLGALSAILPVGKFVPAKLMGVNSPTSKAGLRSQRPTASLVLTAGAAKPLTPAAFWRGKIVAALSPSISPKFASPFRLTAQ